MKEAKTEVLSSEKYSGIHENCFSNFCEFRSIFEGVASVPAVYMCLEYETKLFFILFHAFFFIEKQTNSFYIFSYVLNGN